ncbi:MAG: HEAT repeat domain-containing protein [Sphingosinicella sp.]|uniref:HEAT repeat domain-containing protein n=1 Tax=Sphingosinicella sp. TaxID=1917971 RepID=UPI004037F19C
MDDLEERRRYYPDFPVGLRKLCLDELAALKTPHAVTQLQVAALEDEEPALRSRAIEALGEIGSRKAADALVVVIAKSMYHRPGRPEDREAAARALRRIGEAGVREALLADLSAPEATRRKRAIDVLAALRSPGLSELFVKALGDPDPSVRCEAADALGELADRAAVDPLLAVLTSDADISVREAAARALGAIGDPRVADALLAAEIGVGYLCGALYNFPHSGLIEPLVIKLMHADAMPSWDEGATRNTIAFLLSRIDPDWQKTKEARAAVPALTAGLQSDDPELRQSAARLLRAIADPPSGPSSGGSPRG